MFASHNCHDGYDLFELPDCQWIARMDSPQQSFHMAEFAVFAECGDLVLGQGAAQELCVFRLSGALLTTLDLPWDQTASVSVSTSDEPLVLIG